MLGKKVGKHYDRMGYKLGNVPMTLGGKLNHRNHHSHEPHEEEKSLHSDLERRHAEHNEENHEERRRRHHH